MNKEELKELAFEYSWKIPFRKIVRENQNYELTLGGILQLQIRDKKAHTDLASLEFWRSPADFKELTDGLEDEARAIIGLMDDFIDRECEAELAKIAADKVCGSYKPPQYLHEPKRSRKSKKGVAWNHERYQVFILTMEARLTELNKILRKSYVVKPAFSNISSMTKSFRVDDAHLDVHFFSESGRFGLSTSYPSYNLHLEPVRSAMKLYLALPEMAKWSIEIMSDIAKERR